MELIMNQLIILLQIDLKEEEVKNYQNMKAHFQYLKIKLKIEEVEEL